MKRTFTRFLAGMMLLPLAASAQSPAPTASQQPLHVDYGTALEFRLQLNEIAGIYDELANRMAKAENVAIARSLSAQTDRLSDQDLAFMMAQGIDLEPLAEALRNLRNIVDRNERTAVAGGPVVKTPGLPDANYSAICGSERGNTV